MINMIEGGGWFGGDTKVFYKKLLMILGLSVNDNVIYNKEIKTFVFICSHFC